MNNRQLLIISGILAGSFVLALLLTWMFMEPTPRFLQSRPSGYQSPNTIRQTDENGVTWALNPVGGRPSAGADANGMQVKPVIVVKTDVMQRSERDVLIGLNLEGRNGQRYQAGVLKRGTRMPAPKLRIVDEAGKVILNDSFKYG